MNLFDSSFLCLDIGTHAVRAIAHRVRSGRITKSATHVTESFDSVFALKSVMDELEKQIGAHFDSAFITGNFGDARFEMCAQSTTWSGEHKITDADVRAQVARISTPVSFYPLHIIPLRYDTSSDRNLRSPIGQNARKLGTVFGAIYYERARMDEMLSTLRSAHLGAEAFFDPSLLVEMAHRTQKQTAMLVELGGEFTTESIWSGRGPVFFNKIPLGQKALSQAVATNLGLSALDAERIKCAVADANVDEMARFTPADASHDFSRADIIDIIQPMLFDIVNAVKECSGDEIAKYNPTELLLYGGGSFITGINELFENTFKIPVQNLGADAAVKALAARVWSEQAPRVQAYLARRERWNGILARIQSAFKRKRKKAPRFIPIMPSTQAFNMKSPATYELFKSGGISMIHVDIMDGFFVDRIVGGIEELKFIRAHTDAHLHVHLMTESPAVWAVAAANAGADTIIVSTNTAGVRAALRRIRELGKRSGIALNPESSVGILKPVLKEIDEVLVMSVKPNPGGQKFDENILRKISVLANTRKRYGLKFKISVDSGINPETAQLCWAAGADFLVSGTYLAHAADFPLAVQSLLPTI